MLTYRKKTQDFSQKVDNPRSALAGTATLRAVTAYYSPA